MSDRQESRIRVACYAGARADEEPRRLFIDDREIGIKQIIDRWLDPSHRYFKVRGDDDGIYILRYDISRDIWEIPLSDSGRYDDNQLPAS